MECERDGEVGARGWGSGIRKEWGEVRRRGFGTDGVLRGEGIWRKLVS